MKPPSKSEARAIAKQEKLLERELAAEAKDIAEAEAQGVTVTVYDSHTEARKGWVRHLNNQFRPGLQSDTTLPCWLKIFGLRKRKKEGGK
jgi:hypothetical protein